MVINELLSLTIRSILDGKKYEKELQRRIIYLPTGIAWFSKFSFVCLKWGLTILCRVPPLSSIDT